MTKYIVVHGDTLPGVAEKLGHAGEWQALAGANLALVPDADQQYTDEAKAAIIAERMTPGTELDVPNTWSEIEIEPPASKETPAAKAREAAEEFEERSSRRR